VLVLLTLAPDDSSSRSRGVGGVGPLDVLVVLVLVVWKKLLC